MKKRYVVLPGWGFDASIFFDLESDKLSFQYINLPVIFTSIHEVIITIANLIPDNSDILAWSLGGNISLKIIELYPKKVNSLVILSSTPCFLNMANWYGTRPAAKKLLLNTYYERDINQFKSYFLGLICYGMNDGKLLGYLKKFCNFRNEYYEENLLYLKFLFEVDLRYISIKYSHKIAYILGNMDYVIPKKTDWQLSRINRVFIVNNAGHIPFITHRKDVQNILGNLRYE